MQQVSDALKTAFLTGSVLDAQPRLIAEWNQNRYAGIQIVDNDPSDATVSTMPTDFPITSIVQPNRPTRGVIKARASKDATTQTWWGATEASTGEEGFTSPDYSDNPADARYYTVGPDAPYKYWTSPAPSTTGGAFPVGSEVRPYVIYKTLAWTNKIVVGFENTWATPTSYQIQVTTADSNTGWLTVASNVTPDENGQVTIYRQSSGSWSATVNRDNPTQIRGLRVVVNAIDKGDAHLNLIEISARLERDLTEHLISYDSNFTISEANFITPIGQASANTGEVTLSNLPAPGVIDGMFNRDNIASMYYGLIEHNVKFTLDLGYQLGNATEREWVREFEMYTEEWGGEGTENVSIPLKDASKFMQEDSAPEFFLENITVGEAIWRICDMIGFSKWEYDKKDDDPATILPYFWSDGSETVWGLFQQLAQATQTAIFFDERGYLRIQTRAAAYDTERASSWTLTSVDLDTQNADIIELEKSSDFEANTVNITYKTTKVSEDVRGFPKMDIIWQPEGEFLLRASNLVEPMNTTQMTARTTSEDASAWPYEGYIQVEGEYMKYDAKEYQYYNKAGTTSTVYVTSLDDKNNVDRNLSDMNRSWKNSFTGRFRLTERGCWQSSPRAHSLTVSGMSGRRHTNGTTTTESWAGAYTHNRQASLIRLTTPGNWPANMYYTWTVGQTSDLPFVRYGTRVRIPKAGSGRGTAGMVINVGNADSGYYIELIRSTILNDQGGAGRNAHHEINFGVRKTDGSFKRLGPNQGKGMPFIIAEDVYYDLDVTKVHYNNQHYISIYVNGAPRLSVIVSGTDKIADTGQFGLFGRGPGSVAEYDFLYASRREEVVRPDQSTYLDKRTGAYTSGQWEAHTMPTTFKRTANAREKQNYADFYYNEFGPVMHETREMNVEFEKSPVLHSRLYMTNDYDAKCPEYQGTPFGAKFILCNSSRKFAILNGEDKLPYDHESTVPQHLMVYGRVVFQEDDETHTVQNLDSVTRRGVVEVSFDSKWLQSKSAAEALGAWIVKNWSGGNDELAITAFGNPLFQLGDVVSVHAPEKDIDRATHKYFVVGIRNSFSEGLATNLTLRRARV